MKRVNSEPYSQTHASVLLPLSLIVPRIRYRFLFLPLSIPIFSSCKQSGPPAEAGGPAPAAVDVMIAGMDTVPQDIEVNGTILAQRVRRVASGNQWPHHRLEMEDGAVVSKGALLARVTTQNCAPSCGNRRFNSNSQKNLARLNQLLSSMASTRPTLTRQPTRLHITGRCGKGHTGTIGQNRDPRSVRRSPGLYDKSALVPTSRRQPCSLPSRRPIVSKSISLFRKHTAAT